MQIKLERFPDARFGWATVLRMYRTLRGVTSRADARERIAYLLGVLSDST